jgi:hypothetical protein
VPARNAPLTPEFQAWVRENRAAIREVTHSTPNAHPFRIENRSCST